MSLKLFLLSVLLPATAQATSLLGVSNPADLPPADARQTHVAAHYFAANDLVAVQAFGGDWNGAYTPRDGVNLGLLSGRLETGFTRDAWRLALLYRSEVLIESNRDTADVVHHNKQRLTMPADRSFDLSLRAEGFDADGIRLDKAFDLPLAHDRKLVLGAGISLLHGRTLRRSQMAGAALSTLSGYRYSATLEDSYTEATYPYIRPATPYGQGYALDMGAKMVWANRAQLMLAVNDLLGEIRWHDMPHTRETANSANLAYDPSGYIYYHPSVSGINDINRRTLVQRLTPKFYGKAVVPISRWEFFAATDALKGYWFPQLGITSHLAGSRKITLDYETRFRTLGLNLTDRWYYLSLRSDNTSPGRAKAYGLSAGIHIEL
jgi:hypothetical protein